MKQSQSKKLQFTLDFALPVIDRTPAVFGLPFAPLNLTFSSFAIIGRREKISSAHSHSCGVGFTSYSLLRYSFFKML
jgi:hypothetical protein